MPPSLANEEGGRAPLALAVSGVLIVLVVLIPAPLRYVPDAILSANLIRHAFTLIASGRSCVCTVVQTLRDHRIPEAGARAGASARPRAPGHEPRNRPVARERIQAPNRRVPLLAKAELTPMTSWEDDWRALSGRKGEWLVYRKQTRRWAALIDMDPGRATELLCSIVERYWSVAVDREVQTAVDALLASPPQAWLKSRTFESLIWPACTGGGDRMGFDLFGLEPDLSNWTCVEVKSTDGPAATPFELTINEYRTAAREGRQYVIARVAELHSSSPRISYWRDPVQLVEAGRLALLPVRFQVAVGAPERKLDGAAVERGVAVAE